MLFFSSTSKSSWQLLREESNENHQSENFILSMLITKYFCEFTFIVLSILFLWNKLTLIYVLLIIFILILFLAEIIPVYLSHKLFRRITVLTLPVVKVFSVLLYPAVSIVKKYSDRAGIMKNLFEQNLLISSEKTGSKSIFKRKLLPGNTDKNENEILNNIVELGDRRIYEAMRPRTEIVGLEINSTVEEILDVFIKSGFSKIPVYEENLDNIKGIVLANDFFHHPAGITSVIRDVIFVPETKKCADMLKEFSEKRISFAVAVDEFGGTAGILTMEDILEELFGEIKDEYDTDDILCKKIADNTYIIGGKVEIDYINETLDLKIPQDDYSTIAGFITFHTGRIPDKGENIQIDKFKINILRSNQMRVELVRISVSP